MDMERQKRALASSLYVIVMALEGGGAATVYLDQVADRHSRRDLDIRPELYAPWLECLIRAVSEYDPLYDEVVEQVWRGVMSEAIQRMTDRY
jgi:hemoglobin-like flavoprotein